MNKHEQATRFAEKGTKAASEIIERGIRSAEEATNGVKQSISSSVAGMQELNAKLIDMAHANANAVFDLAHEMASVQTPSDLVAIWSTHAKRQFEMMTKQAQELTEVGQRLASRSTEPLSHNVNEAFRHRT
jgi:phasin